MIKPGRIITELYAIISNGNYSFLRIKKALWPLKYQVGILFLDELEKKFRELFDLAPYTNQAQDTSVEFIDTEGTSSSLYITHEFYQRLHNGYICGELMLSQGYVVFIRKNKTWDHESDQSILMQNILLELESMKLFSSRLEKSLRLTKRGNIIIDQVFAYVPNEHKIVKSLLAPILDPLPAENLVFEEKDNYALKLYLNIDNKIAYAIDLAMQNFVESFRIQNAKLRYLNMLLSLDLCFNKSSEESFEIICRYVSRLLARNAEEFQHLMNESINFYHLKNKIIQGNISKDLITESESEYIRWKMLRLEEIVRSVLKKMIRFNHKERSKFIEELESKI